MNTNQTLTRRFRNLLHKRIKEEKKLSQRDLAKAIGISAASVNRWMNGGAPEIDKLPQLCEILEVTPNELFGYKPEDIDQESYKLFKSIQKDPSYKKTINELLKLIAKDIAD